MYKRGIESNIFKEFKITIDGIELTQGQIISLKINWDMEHMKVMGELVMLDPSDLVEENPLRGNNLIIMNIIDYDDVLFFHKFKVVKVRYKRTQEGDYSVVLEFLDLITLEHIKTHRPKSWASINIRDIIEDNEVTSGHMNEKRHIYTPKKLFAYKNFIIPTNNNLNSVLKWLANDNNLYFFQSRDTIYLEYLAFFLARPPKKAPYIYKTNNIYYRENVYEFEANQGDILNKSIYQANSNLNSIAKGKNIITSKLVNSDTLGSKEYYIPTKNKAYIDYIIKINRYKNNKLEILVPGQFSNNIGDRVIIDFVNLFRSVGPEKNLNGYWLIKEIVDLFLIPDYVQKLTLVRSKYN